MKLINFFINNKKIELITHRSIHKSIFIIFILMLMKHIENLIKFTKTYETYQKDKSKGNDAITSIIAAGGTSGLSIFIQFGRH